jgi:hypothetical protein
MATLLAHDALYDDQAESQATPGDGQLSTRAAWLWTVFGVVLMGAFLSLVVDDYPLRSLMSVR